MEASKQPINPPTSTVAPTAPTTQEVPVQADTTTPSTPPQVDNERWAQLARKEKALRALERDLKTREAQTKAPAPQAGPDWKERIKSDFYGTIAEAGVGQEELVNYAINAKPEDLQMRQLRAELAALKAGQTEVNTRLEQSQKQAYDQAIKQISQSVNTLVDRDETFETIKAMGRQDAVVELIEQTYKDEGTLMTVEDAAKQVEDYLTEQAVSLMKLKKIQSKLTPPKVETTPLPVAEQKQVPNQKQHTVSTLTHSITSPSSKSATSRERRERAIAAFKGQLK